MEIPHRRGIRSVSYDEATPSLAAEAEGAASLLSAAGICAMVDVDVTNLTPASEQVLAWGLREGVANVLRHNNARSCTITAWRGVGVVALRIVNDGALRPGPQGTGITCLTERALSLSGRVIAVHRDDTFELLVELPRDAR